MTNQSNSTTLIKVSVIIPVYNVENYISETLESLQNQTLKEIEFIFIDDKGNDNSWNIIQRVAPQDSRIVLIQNEKNIGAGASRNKGIEIARGEFIAFMDSDDLIDSQFYEKLYNKAHEENLLVTKGNLQVLHKDGTKTIRPTNENIKNKLSMFKNMLCLFASEHVSAIYSKQAINKAHARYHETLQLGEDIYFQMSLMRTIPTERFGIVDDAFYTYRTNYNSITHSNNNNILSLLLEVLYAKINYLLNVEDSYESAVYISENIECFLYQSLETTCHTIQQKKRIYQIIDCISKLVKTLKKSGRIFISNRSIRLLQITLYNHSLFYIAMKLRLKLHQLKCRLRLNQKLS